MRARVPLSLLGAFCLVGAGCLSHQVAADGCNFRQALLDMYTDQVMDNLISAANGQAFVQLDYHGLIVTDKQIVKASIGDESDPTSMKTFNRMTRALFASMHTYTNKILYGGTFDSNRQMQLMAEPVSGKSDIYDYYIAFARDPALFCCTEEKPAHPVHIAKQRGCQWYWVPPDAAGVFLQLALRTAFMRGPEQPPPIYWETSIVAVSPRYNKDGQWPVEDNKNEYVVTFSSEVPNDDGFATVTLDDGHKVRLALQTLDSEPFIKDRLNQRQVPLSLTSTRRLYANYDPEPTKVGVEQMANRPALVYANSNPNLKAKKSPELQRLDDALDNYRRSLKHQDRAPSPAPASDAAVLP